MSFSFSSLVRLIALLVVGSTVFAVGVSRIEREAPIVRTPKSPRLIGVNDFYMRDDHRDTRWFDLDTGHMEPMSVEPGDLIEAASQSPWSDARGQSQIVGRWSVRSKIGPLSTSNDFGLARYTFPGGKLIDHVSTDIMPIGPPAWYPGTRARVLYASGDGRLHQLAFEGNDPKSGSAAKPAHEVRPRLIGWNCPRPGLGEPYISDIHWGEDPRLGGAIVVSLRRRELDPDGIVGYSRSELWWLKLDKAGGSIDDAGSLTPDYHPSTDERCPTLAALPDGRLAISFLRQQRGEKAWKVVVGLIRMNPGRGVPEIVADSLGTLEPRVHPAASGFSSDGRYVAVVVGSTADKAVPARLSTESILFPNPAPAAGPEQLAAQP